MRGLVGHDVAHDLAVGLLGGTPADLERVHRDLGEGEVARGSRDSL